MLLDQILRSFHSKVLLSGLSMAVLGGCGGASDGEVKSGCTADDQCKEGRICQEGTCVYPTAVSDGGYSGNTTGNGGGNTGNYADNGNTSQPSCTPHNSQSCYQGDVYWLNSCGDWEERVTDCTENQYCNAGACLEGEAQCDPQTTKTCYSDDVYWLDSCGNVGEMFANCSATQYCQDSLCVERAPECTPHASKACSDGDVYWRDSCGGLEDLFEDCDENQVCENGGCSCPSHTRMACDREGRGGHVYYFDSCGNKENLVQRCQGPCSSGGCIEQYLDRQNDTVLDVGNHFLWSNERGMWDLDWEEANSYCEGLILGERTDWRLPSYSELLTVLTWGIENPCISYNCNMPCQMAQFGCSEHWTSTPCDSSYKSISFRSPPYESCIWLTDLANVHCVTEE